ncbi:MAG TPA: hypothetical protein VM890_15850 [Longimicrobium sp.]|nr:hypothetical protein [Longimicrobium sp.]
MKTLFLAWLDPIQRRWYPVGRLTNVGDEYEFRYTEGALAARAEAGFRPLAAFPQLTATYRSPELFALFSNRLLPRSRPDYREFIEWLHIPANEVEPFVILARSGGRRATDTFEVFPEPQVDENGIAVLHFFIHGIGHSAEGAVQRALAEGERLLLLHDLQNPFDRNALALRTVDSSPGDFHLLGFCPRYVSEEVLSVVREHPERVRVEVAHVNPPPAPAQMRVLCSMRLPIGAASGLFRGAKYQPLTNQVEPARKAS